MKIAWPQGWKERRRAWHLRRRLPLYGLALLAALALHHEIFGADGYLAFRREQAIYQSHARELARLTLDNQKLHASIRQLRGNPHAIARIARRQLHLTRPGEIIYTYPKSSRHR